VTGGPRKIVMGISGASGAPYAARLSSLLADARRAGDVEEVGVVLSRTAAQVWRHEVGGDVREAMAAHGFAVAEGRDYDAPYASGSAGYAAMVVVPASMSCIARIAHGISDDLLTRAADVVLKERRKLILVARESPYSEIHLRNMLEVTRAGAVVLPATPSFYGRPTTLEHAIDTVVARILDHLGLPSRITARWGAEVRLDPPEDP
jgi:4-hydroxy-3-polyprenylbenzoate decarboxylase